MALPNIGYQQRFTQIGNQFEAAVNAVGEYRKQKGFEKTKQQFVQENVPWMGTAGYDQNQIATFQQRIDNITDPTQFDAFAVSWELQKQSYDSEPGGQKPMLGLGFDEYYKLKMTQQAKKNQEAITGAAARATQPKQELGESRDIQQPMVAGQGGGAFTETDIQSEGPRPVTQEDYSARLMEELPGNVSQDEVKANPQATAARAAYPTQNEQSLMENRQQQRDQRQRALAVAEERLELTRKQVEEAERMHKQNEVLKNSAARNAANRAALEKMPKPEEIEKEISGFKQAIDRQKMARDMLKKGGSADPILINKYDVSIKQWEEQMKERVKLHKTVLELRNRLSSSAGVSSDIGGIGGGGDYGGGASGRSMGGGEITAEIDGVQYILDEPIE